MQANDKRTIVEVPPGEGTKRGRGRSSDGSPRWLKARLRPSDSPDDQNGQKIAAGRLGAFADARVGHHAESVATLVANPSSASAIPVDQIPALIAELASEQSALSALQGVLTTRLLLSKAETTQTESGDRLLTVDEVATTLGVTKRWVQRRARRLPFARRISDHAIRYSEAGLKRWMSNRKLSAA